MPDLWLLLIPGLPLLAACWIAARLLLRWGRGDEAEYLTAYSVMGAGALSLLLIVVAAVQHLRDNRKLKAVEVCRRRNLNILGGQLLPSHFSVYTRDNSVQTRQLCGDRPP